MGTKRTYLEIDLCMPDGGLLSRQTVGDRITPLRWAWTPATAHATASATASLADADAVVASAYPVHGELPNWPECGGSCGADTIAGMRDFLILFVLPEIPASY